MATNELKGKAGFTPYGNRIVVKVHKVDRTKGGVVLPENSTGFTDKAVETPTCEVLAVGPEVKQCKVGDTLLVPGSAPGVNITFKGQKMLMLPEDHIAGIIDNVPE